MYSRFTSVNYYHTLEAWKRFNVVRLDPSTVRARSPADKASASEAGERGFESHRARLSSVNSIYL
jgi:hypothetical protein